MLKLPNKVVSDLIFFLLVIALPSSFFNFIDRSFFFDLRLVYLIVGFFFLLFYFKYIPKIALIYGGKLLLLVVGFISFKVLHSIFIQGIPWVEVATVFRTNFYYPIATLGFLLYASKMDNDRIIRFLRWVIIVTFAAGIFYIVSNLTGINLYANQAKDFPEFRGVTIAQNLLAVPDYNVFLYTTGLLGVITTKGFNKHWFWIVPLIVTVLSIVRNQMIVYVLIAFLLIIGGFISNLKLHSIKVISASFALILVFVMMPQVFPVHMGRVIDKFGFDQQEITNIETYTEQPTFQIRLHLIDESYTRTERNGKLILGNGYIREAIRGTNDFVIGGDTRIAPVLWTEGFSGLILRILPVLYFLGWGCKHLKDRDKQVAATALIMISMIFPEMVNIVQTKIFTLYHHHTFIFYLFMMLIYNQDRHNDTYRLTDILR